MGNFNSLFEKDIKCFYIGTLADIARRNTCSFCRLVVQIIKSVWAKWDDKVWEPSRAANINVWVKTTLWAHYSEERDSNAHFRYRPSLGTDWEPDDRQRTSYGSPRYTLCEVDRVGDSDGFKYFTGDIDQDVEQVLTRRKIPALIDQALLKSWIQECQSNHALCAITGGTKQALLRDTGRFRVVDVEAGCLVVPSRDISYTALSYVWGGILHTKTEAERVKWVDSLFESKPSTSSTNDYLRVENLPTTIQDAIKLTSLMGWKYIWIDLLCIHQNDTTDKEVLVKEMHLIYEQASFTIFAASGEDANAPLAGLFNPRDTESIGQITLVNESIFMAPARPQLPDLLGDTAWATRGWTFQEDVLSRCCLYFTSTEVFYSCQEHLKEYPLAREAEYNGFGIGRFNEWRESYVLETRLSKTAYQDISPWNEGWRRLGKGASCLRSRATVLGTNDSAEDGTQLETRAMGLRYSFNFQAQHIPENERFTLFEEYARFVADYSRRELSNPGDVVEAMMGIFNKFTDTPNIKAHGMIGDQLELNLLWVARKETSLRRRQGLPSWSWAGWIGPVVYEFTGHGQSRWVFSPRKCTLMPVQRQKSS
ncbi:hypothetical protein NW768_002648 [Fusarium equiseti]|uniref:Heterokaryon incompatibility domain-containing protein n=1 Tax=Fusarium equiseti TaxID=61235 RepID=A0ABQ8RNX0_FUSEQ|nr:hypothetical protein NW768_002648 [Fusarium equiseti]